jgi:hypothetical protein
MLVRETRTLAGRAYIDLDLLPVRILDGGIIALYPHILDKLRYIGCQILVYAAGIQCHVDKVPVRQLLPTPPCVALASAALQVRVGRRGGGGFIPAPRTTI